MLAANALVLDNGGVVAEAVVVRVAGEAVDGEDADVRRMVSGRMTSRDNLM